MKTLIMLGTKLQFMKEGFVNHEIILDNGKIFEIKDTSFNKYANNLGYLKLENILSNIKKLGILIASFLYLLVRKETITKNRDLHNKFSVTESLVFKQDFLDRPIIMAIELKVEKIKSKLVGFRC